MESSKFVREFRELCPPNREFAYSQTGLGLLGRDILDTTETSGQAPKRIYRGNPPASIPRRAIPTRHRTGSSLTTGTSKLSC